MAEQAPLSIRRLVVRANSRQQAESAATSIRRGLDGCAPGDAAGSSAPRSIRLQVDPGGDPGHAAAQALRSAITGGGHG